MFAAHNGRPELVKALLAAHADPDLADFEGRTALTFAVLLDRADVVRLLLDGGAESDRMLQLDDFGRLTLLALAAGRGQTAVVEALLAHGADPNRAVDAARFGPATPLILAASGGHAETVSALLAAGGDPARLAGGESALTWARRAERSTVVGLLEARVSTD